MTTTTNGGLWVIAGIWLTLVSGALLAMADYASIEGDAGSAPVSWPEMSTLEIQRETDKPTLVMFAHPLCPCTRASLWELEKITNRMYGLFNTHVLFFRPEDTAAMPELWTASDLKTIAQRLPGTTIHDDMNGDLANHFGVYTSGHVLLYDSHGKLQFAGGITPSRGHAGSNAGSATVISTILSDDNVDPLKVKVNPVYGCSLHTDGENDRKLTPNIGITTTSM